MRQTVVVTRLAEQGQARFDADVARLVENGWTHEDATASVARSRSCAGARDEARARSCPVCICALNTGERCPRHPDREG